MHIPTSSRPIYISNFTCNFSKIKLTFTYTYTHIYTQHIPCMYEKAYVQGKNRSNTRKLINTLQKKKFYNNVYHILYWIPQVNKPLQNRYSKQVKFQRQQIYSFQILTKSIDRQQSVRPYQITSIVQTKIHSTNIYTSHQFKSHFIKYKLYLYGNLNVLVLLKQHTKLTSSRPPKKYIHIYRDQILVRDAQSKHNMDS
eukprot:TRINITY_DN27229_c0_g3_i3.p2 TRINITY_DN27229_c0_g3~~TRINITY_DN27229_c0_g3_i3.p2  ORF type:complete len:198 (-),score=-31.15 TRINITY_DN27229_c0_g3_i3:64-657(-)